MRRITWTMCWLIIRMGLDPRSRSRLKKPTVNCKGRGRRQWRNRTEEEPTMLLDIGPMQPVDAPPPFSI